MNKDLQATHEVLSMLEQSKLVMDHLIDDASGVFMSLSKEGHILRANRELARHLNSSHEDVLGTHWTKLFDNEGICVFEFYFKQLLTGSQKRVEFEQAIRTHDGAMRDYHWQIAPMRAVSNIEVGGIYTCLGKDVTDIKKSSARAAEAAKDLELVEALQKLILPSRNEFKSDHLNVAASYRSASISGGDCWFFDWTGNGNLRILIGDVTGHGAGPAMVTALVAGIVGATKNIQKSSLGVLPVQQLLEIIGDQLNNLPGQPYWMTASAIEIDVTTRKLKWWSAAGTPLVYLSSKGTVEFITKSSSPLGVKDLKISSGEIDFHPGDRVLLATDGVHEMQNAQNQMWDMRRLKEFMLASQNLSATEARGLLLERLDAWSERAPLQDDTTFVYVEAIK